MHNIVLREHGKDHFQTVTIDAFRSIAPKADSVNHNIKLALSKCLKFRKTLKVDKRS